tara:strand:- start:18 stop:134 length:117 start_codon:yes stop_codon:yes gene_type:complete
MLAPAGTRCIQDFLILIALLRVKRAPAVSTGSIIRYVH